MRVRTPRGRPRQKSTHGFAETECQNCSLRRVAYVWQCRVSMTSISIAELQRAGIAIAAHEAVAIAQHLIHDRRARAAEPPFGSPSPDNVSIGADGTVACRGCMVTPTASEIAIFLQAVLSNGPSVPGGLRYAIARAMHEVDAPPFDSVDDFSVVLAHYERGVRIHVLRALAAKMEPHRRVASVSRMTIDRRRGGPSSSELRRLLREADRELFERRVVLTPPPGSQLMRSRLRIVGAAILCVLTAGGTGSSSSRTDRGAGSAAPQESAAPEESAVDGRPAVRPAQGMRNTSRVERTASRKRAVPQPRVAPRDQHPPSRKTASRGVLDTLRLRWLRHAIVIRDDL